MLSLRAVLLAVLAAGLSHIDAHAQIPDGALLPAAADAVEAMTTETSEPEPQTSRYGEVMLETGGGGEIVLVFRGATRREILNRLLAGLDVEIEWRNKAAADERLQGRRLGASPVELARRLLARVNYLMYYDSSSNEARLARIVVLGSDPPSVTRRAGQEAEPSELARRRAAIEAARRAITAAQQ